MQASQQKSTIQPFKLANKEGGVKFKWPVKALTRLASMLYSDAGEVKVTVNAHFNDYKRCLLETKITADLTLECQTTFEPIEHKVEKKIGKVGDKVTAREFRQASRDYAVTQIAGQNGIYGR